MLFVGTQTMLVVLKQVSSKARKLAIILRVLPTSADEIVKYLN